MSAQVTDEASAKSAIDALVFDVDGTLVDTEETHRQAFNLAFAELHLGFAWDAEEYADLLAIAGGKERLTHYFAALDQPAAERERLVALVPEVHARKTKHFAELVSSGGSPLRPGVAPLLDDARAAGLPVAIASTTTAANVEALLRASFGADGAARFAVIACGDVVPAKKPAPDIYTYALARLQVPASRAVAFEDSAIGLSAAKAAGLFCVVTPTRWTADQDLRAADLLLPHLGDALPGSGSRLTLEALRAQRSERR
jgi:HAD superfamily hydrolase (TIGR01509 family)